MMARSTTRSNQRPDTLMQHRSCQADETSCNARPDHTSGSESNVYEGLNRDADPIEHVMHDECCGDPGAHRNNPATCIHKCAHGRYFNSVAICLIVGARMVASFWPPETTRCTRSM